MYSNPGYASKPLSEWDLEDVIAAAGFILSRYREIAAVMPEAFTDDPQMARDRDLVEEIQRLALRQRATGQTGTPSEELLDRLALLGMEDES